MIFLKNVIKYIFVFILLIIFLYAFSSSYTSHNIDNLAYIIAMGIDSTDSGKIKVSFQFTETSAFSKNNSSSGSGIVIDTIEASSIDSAINLINAYIGKEVNLAHCKVVVFSETIAKNGLSNYIYGLMNNSQLRPTSNIIISRCDAKYYIENSESKYEKIITKYYEIFPNSANYTGYTSNVTIGEFFNNMTSTTSNPVAILGGANLKSPSNTNTANNDANILANESTVSGERGTENIGLAVFKNDTLVGELTALEALCHSIVTHEVNTFLISIPDPENPSTNLDLSVSEYKKPKIKVDVANGSPHISVDVYLNARILSMHNNINFLNEDYLNRVSNSANNYLKSCISEYLYKTSTEFKCCIDNFDKYAINKFLTTPQWEEYNWVSQYQNAFFDVNAYIDVSSGLLVTESQ